MKLKFKHQTYQLDAVNAVADCFAGQPKSTGLSYRIDPGREVVDDGQVVAGYASDGFKNAELALSQADLLKNVQAVQRGQNLPVSTELAVTKSSKVNLDIEMETGTGKTYCYIRTMFELHQRYGWSKYIVVVPSIAIREGVHKSFEITADHFLEDYRKRARFFIYNSKQLHNLESFSSDAGINVIIINVQAFAARGKDQRRIYEELDDFQSRRPIDVIKANRPILILDEPQKMEGRQTQKSLEEFNALMILRYSATHKTEHNRIFRLDALDAYNQKLVKKINVRGISVKGLSGTNAYLYLESIQISASKPPEARLEFEIKRKSGIKPVLRRIGRNDDLHTLSGGLDQYQGFVVADIDAHTDTIEFSNGHVLAAGQATGDVNETTLRRIQIRETIKAHIDKEQRLFQQGIKVLSLFFIDEVAKYRQYDDEGETPGEYARMFEEEYDSVLNEVLELDDTPYQHYLKSFNTACIHDGYFSIDKKTKRLTNPDVARRGELEGQSSDVDAYDLILKHKERLLSFGEPVRFIFSHSALREGWDNPNVFGICTLKHSDNSVSRRQEVGRGLRLAVNQDGERIDDPAIVHQTNVLTVVANESYHAFVSALQKDISESLSARPRLANEEYFTGKLLKTEEGELEVSKEMAAHLEFFLIRNGYVDVQKRITDKYHDAKDDNALAPLPVELQPHAEQVFALIDSVFSEAQLPEIADERKAKTNPLNENFRKKEFQELWGQINRKAVYAVDFDSEELIAKCIATLDKELTVRRLQYSVVQGEQIEKASYDDLQTGKSFRVHENTTETHEGSVQSAVKYDLLGSLAGEAKLTRKTIARILSGLQRTVFAQFKSNPEDFLQQAARLINEQKATVIVEHLAYDPTGATHSIDIFTQEKPKDDFSKAHKADHHIYDYVFTDSKKERTFLEDLDTSTEVVVYAKLPKAFFIPTPVGSYNPDWAIAFKQGSVKHVYFIAETKGSMSTMQLRKIEESKIECARKFFARITSDKVKYDVIESYGMLMQLVT